MKQVSVIIPNYNHAPFLQKRIESVLKQTWSNFELIILDDCSTDNSVKIINQYRDHPKVSQIILNTDNSGSPFFQWEKGFQLANGEIIWIAESDDYAENNFLEKLIPLFSEKIGLVYCDSNVINGKDKIHPDFYKAFKNKRFSTSKWDSDYVCNGIDELRENLFYECTINNMSATLFKKDLLVHVDWNFLKSFKYCGDWFFLISISRKTNIAYVNEALNYFKYGTNNFKSGTKSVMNYFFERFKARYYHSKELLPSFSKSEKKLLYRELGIELRLQLNDILKGNSSLKGYLRLFKELIKINKGLFTHQLKYALKQYIWKN